MLEILKASDNMKPYTLHLGDRHDVLDSLDENSGVEIERVE